MSFFDIIMPTHGRPYLLQRAIKSIRRQQFDDVRLIIISDDPHSQALASIQPLLKPHDLFIQRFHATGPSASRNEGLKHITAEFVLFLDDDDTYAPNFLKDLHTALQSAQGDVFAVDFDVAREFRDDAYADVYKFERWYESFKSADFSQLWVKNFLPNNTVVYRAHTLANKHFHEDIGYEDWVFLLDVLKDYPICYLPVRGAVSHLEDGRAEDSFSVEQLAYVYARFPVQGQLVDKRQTALAQVKQDYTNLPVMSKRSAMPVNSLSDLVSGSSRHPLLADKMRLLDAFNVGDDLYKQNDLAGAIQFYEACVQHYANELGVHVLYHQLGFLYTKQVRFDQAAVCFYRVLTIVPSFHRSRFLLAESLIRLGKKAEAQPLLQYLLNPTNGVEKENKALFEAAKALLKQII